MPKDDGAIQRFALDAGEANRAFDFRIRCDAAHGRPKSPEGARYTYSFTPTSIGTVVRIACLQCGAIEDLTDYAQW